MGTVTTISEEIVRQLKEINMRLRVIEEMLGAVYDDEGVFDPEIVEELKKRAKDAHSMSEEEFWRELGVED